MIPRIIHQIWLGPKRPPRYTMESCREVNRGWQYRVWTDRDEFPLVNRRLFNSFRKIWYAKADVLRYELLLRFGGIYVDADQLCLRSFDDLIEETSFFAGYQNLGNPNLDAAAQRSPLIANGIIGAEPDHPILQRVIADIGDDERTAVMPWIRVGPGALTRAIAEVQAPAVIHPFHRFYPYASTEPIPEWPQDMVKAIHYRSHSVSLWGSTLGTYGRCRSGPRGKAPSTYASVSADFAERHPLMSPALLPGAGESTEAVRAAPASGGRAASEGAPVISVVVCTHNRASLLETTLQSLARQTMPRERYEVIVVENGCTDTTRTITDRFLREHANFNVIRLVSPGKSRAANAGWRAAHGRFIAFIDDDAQAPPTWLEQIVSAFSSPTPAPAVVLGRVFPVCEGTPPSWWALAMATKEPEKGFLPPHAFYPVSGSNFAVERRAIAECGGFAEDRGPIGNEYRAGEDTELVHRLAQRFPAVWYDPSIAVGHWVPARAMTLTHILRRAGGSGAAAAAIYGPRVISTLVPAVLSRVRQLEATATTATPRHVTVAVILVLAARRLTTTIGIAIGLTALLVRNVLGALKGSSRIDFLQSADDRSES